MSKLPAIEKNSPEFKEFLEFKFGKPSISEYLRQLTHQQKSLGKNTESFCQTVWDAFAIMNDEERNHLLNGLLARSSSNQLQFIKTRTSAVSSESTSDIFLKYQLVKKSNKPSLQPPTKQKQKPKLVESTDPKITKSLYVRLLNLRYDHERLVEHLKVAGNDSTKIFLELLSNRCKKIERMIESFSSVVLTNDDETAIDILLRNALELLDATHATIYSVDEKIKCFVVKYSSWRKQRDKILTENILGAAAMMKSKEPYNLQNIKSIILDFPDELANSYSEVELNNCISVPILSNGKCVGIMEMLDKKGGALLFDAEDEFILKQLSGICTIVMTHTQIREEARRRSDDIQAVLKTASLMSSEVELTELIRIIMLRAQQLLSAERVSLFIVDKERQELWTSVAKGVAEIRIPINKGIAGFVATTGTTLNIPDAYADMRFNREVDKKTGFKTRNILCMPMRDSNGEVLGVTQIINKLPDTSTFTQSDELLLEAFSALAAATIERSFLFDKIQATLSATSRVKNNLDTILISIADVVITLSPEGHLVHPSFANSKGTINHPDKLGIRANIDEMKTTGYKAWLKGNDDLITHIDKVFNGGGMVQAYEYDLMIGGKLHSVNYTVIALQPNDKDNMAKALIKRRPTSPPGSSNRGVLLVVETISEEKRILATLGRYMNSALAQQLVNENSSVLTGQRLNTSVVLTNLRSFKAITENMDPKTVVSILNDHYSQTVDAILAEQGVLDKYMGDAAMAVFGIPLATKDHAERAVSCTFRIKSGLEALNAKHRRFGRPSMRMGIAVSTGQTLSGNIGSNKRLEYTIVGDNVGIAELLIQATKDYGILIAIDEATLSELNGKYITREIDQVNNSKFKKVTVHEVISPIDQDLSEEAVSGLKSFAYGLEEYRRMNWSQANAYFNRTIQLLDDEPSKQFVDRIRMIQTGQVTIPEDWDGSWPPIGCVLINGKK